MSTNHTPHFNLSQWQASDQVLRTDFNEDNAKIDAALAGLSAGLAGKAGKWEPIGQYSMNGNFDVTVLEFPRCINVNWDEWEHVACLWEFYSNLTDDNDKLLLQGFFPDSSSVLEDILNSKVGHVILIFSPHHDKTSSVTAFGIAHGVSIFSSNQKYQDLSGIQINRKGVSGHPLSKYKVRFFGMKY